MCLEKVVKEKDELWYWTCQLKCHINYREASSCALKFTLSFWGLRFEKPKADSHPGTGWITVQLTPHGTSTFKVVLVLGKEWDPGYWERDVWKDPDEAGDLESLNSSESSLPVEVASSTTAVAASPLPVVTSSPPTPDWRDQPCIGWEKCNDLPGPVTKQDNTDSPRTHPHRPTLLLDLYLEWGNLNK